MFKHFDDFVTPWIFYPQIIIGVMLQLLTSPYTTAPHLALHYSSSYLNLCEYSFDRC